MNNFDYVKLKTFCTKITNENKIKREETNWGKNLYNKKLQQRSNYSNI